MHTHLLFLNFETATSRACLKSDPAFSVPDLTASHASSLDSLSSLSPFSRTSFFFSRFPISRLYLIFTSASATFALALKNPVRTNDVRWREHGAFWLFHVINRTVLVKAPSLAILSNHTRSRVK